MSGGDVAIISSVHHPDDGRLTRWRAALERAGLDVVVDCRLDRPRGLRRVIRRAWLDVVLPWRYDARVLLVPDPDLAITALLVARLRRRVVVADVHEDYVGVAAEREWARGVVRGAAALVARAAAIAAARADLTIITDPDHRPHTARHRRLVVLNVPARGELGDAGAADDEPRAVYIGDVRITRGLRDMVEAVLATRSWSLDIVGPIVDADRTWVEDRCRATGSRIRLHGRLAPPEAWRIAEGAWVGLSLLHDNPAFRVIMPTKVYEYLAFGLPVLSTPLPRVIERVGTLDAVTITPAKDVAAVLEAWAANPAQMRARRDAAREWRSANIPVRSDFDDAAALIAAAARR